MVVTVLIGVCLILGYHYGSRRGLLRMVLNLVSYLIAIIGAKIFAISVGSFLANIFPIISSNQQTGNNTSVGTDGNLFFYHGVAFLVIFILIMAICRIIVRKFNLITKLPVIHQANAFAGGLISLALVYVTIFLLLTVFQIIPNQWWQDQITNSVVAQWIINNTPLLTQMIGNWLAGH